MAITQLDPVTALVVIDLQKGLKGLPVAPFPFADVVAKSAQLAQAFRARKLPVVWVNVTGGAPGRVERSHSFTPPADWAELVPELGVQADDLKVTKLTWGAFHGTPLDMLLRRRGVTQIVLTGVATSIGVETTARAAYEHGYNVTLATDAMTDLDAGNHLHAIEAIFPRLGETGTTAEVLAKLS